MRSRRAWILAGAVVASACVTPDGASTDAARSDAPDGATTCNTDLDCDDGAFCDGVERCAVTAGTHACTQGAAACSAGQSCDESLDLCLPAGCDHADADGDGVRSIACGGADCDDADPDRFAGHPEICDALAHDEDCTPCTIASASTGDGDLDRDGYVSMFCANDYVAPAPMCDPLVTQADAMRMRIEGLDCDDMNASIHPRQIESCNGVDDDCDHAVDEAVLRSFYPDADHDGYGQVGSTAVVGCGAPMDHVENDTDCDDSNNAIHPGTAELCNGIDEDCDVTIDEGAAPTFFYADRDGDGFGDPTAPIPASTCSPPAGQVTNTDDCDDTRAFVHPGAIELCDGLDDDCTLAFPRTGGADASEDADGDLHAPLGATCTTGFPIDDCDDARAATHPGANEVCNAVDDDCDGAIDEEPDASRACTVAESCLAGRCTDVLGVSCGGYFTCAIRADRTLGCWGSNSQGQLGDGTTNDSLTATMVPLADVAEVSASNTHTCARTASGQLYCWGDNSSRQVGDGTNVMRPSPVLLDSLSDIVDVATGSYHSCAIDEVGSAWCWGSNTTTTPMCGNGTFAGPIPSPDPVLGLHDAVEIAASSNSTCARRRTGTVVCWGGNFAGQLGDGTHAQSPVPVAVAGIANAVQIVAASQYGCARIADGTVRCWGSAPSLPAITDAVSIAGAGGLCVLHATGTVECFDGPSGDPSSITDAVRMEASFIDVCVRRESGALLCWGDDSAGQVGDGMTGFGWTVLTPFQVPGFP